MFPLPGRIRDGFNCVKRLRFYRNLAFPWRLSMRSNSQAIRQAQRLIIADCHATSINEL